MEKYGIQRYAGSNEEPKVIHVQVEPPRLLWRSIVQGFGLAVGFFLAAMLFWLAAAFLFTLLLSRSLPIPGTT